MKRNVFVKIIAGMLTAALFAGMTWGLTGCEKDTSYKAPENVVTYENGSVIGEGQTVFYMVVSYPEGNEEEFEFHTDKETVGEALTEHGFIAGDDSAYGMYVKTVNGVTVDYDTDGKYWAFYEDGEYGMYAVDATKILPEYTYAFIAEE